MTGKTNWPRISATVAVVMVGSPALLAAVPDQPNDEPLWKVGLAVGSLYLAIASVHLLRVMLERFGVVQRRGGDGGGSGDDRLHEGLAELSGIVHDLLTTSRSMQRGIAMMVRRVEIEEEMRRRGVGTTSLAAAGDQQQAAVRALAEQIAELSRRVESLSGGQK